MRLTPWMLTIAAFLLIAALAVGFLFKKLFAREVVQAPEPARRNVPMASADIEPGTILERRYLGEGPWLEEDLRQYPDTILSMDALVGRIAREKIPAATPLRASMFYPPGQGPDPDVDPGKRAVSVDVGTSTEMVAGLLRPGQFVDVFLTVGRQGGVPLQNTGGRRSRASTSATPDGLTMKLFDGVKLIAMSGQVGGPARAGNFVTLELDAEQQDMLVLAKDHGSISVTYNPDGPGSGGLAVEPAKEGRITMRDLLGVEEEEEEDRPFETEQFRNGGRSSAFYDEDGKRVRYSGWDSYGNDDGGVPLQSTGGSGGWSTTSADSAPSADEVASSEPAASL